MKSKSSTSFIHTVNPKAAMYANQLWTTTGYAPTSAAAQNPNPTSLPPFVYRVHRSRAQTYYDFSTGFRAKNQTTIVNLESVLLRFGLAHLKHQTNISSPFISVYNDHAHAEAVARYFANLYHEDTWVVTIDTNHLSRGPVFWAANLLAGQELSDTEKWLHAGEYLCLYRISPQAIRDETLLARTSQSCGVIGGSR